MDAAGWPPLGDGSSRRGGRPTRRSAATLRTPCRCKRDERNGRLGGRPLPIRRAVRLFGAERRASAVATHIRSQRSASRERLANGRQGSVRRPGGRSLDRRAAWRGVSSAPETEAATPDAAKQAVASGWRMGPLPVASAVSADGVSIVAPRGRDVSSAPETGAATPDAARRAVAAGYDARMTPPGCKDGIIRRSGRPGEYGYNALGWRVKKIVSNSGDLNGTFRMIYNQSWQLLEIRAVSGGSTTVAKQFVHADPGVNSPALALGVRSGLAYVDDHIAMFTPSGTGWLTHYYHTDALFNTLALTCGTGDPAGGQVAERSLFEPYGTAALTDSDGDPLSNSAIGNPFQRQGIVRDWETANDENRHRVYLAAIGRWGQRDPITSNGVNTAWSATRGLAISRFGQGIASAVTVAPDPCSAKLEPVETEWIRTHSDAWLVLPNSNLYLFLVARPLLHTDAMGLIICIDLDAYNGCVTDICMPQLSYCITAAGAVRDACLSGANSARDICMARCATMSGVTAWCCRRACDTAYGATVLACGLAYNAAMATCTVVNLVCENGCFEGAKVGFDGDECPEGYCPAP
jgi:hypothetical protein